MLEKTSSGHWLVSDFDHRDPKDDLHDVETGRSISEIDKLPQYLRQLLQESDLYVELNWDHDNNHYQVVKIVSKRDPLFLQGDERITIQDKYGHKMSIDPEMLDEFIGLKENPEELFLQEGIERVSIETEYCNPRDVWDLIMDESHAIVTQVEPGGYERDEYGFPVWKDTKVEKVIDEDKCYSARMYEYHEDKRIKHRRARRILQLIQTKDLSKKELVQLMAPRKDKRPEMASQMKSAARTIIIGSIREKIEARARILMRDFRKSENTYEQDGGDIPSTEKNILWMAWERRQMELYGKVELPSWKYEKRLRYKLTQMANKGEIPINEIEPRVSAAMENQFGTSPKNKSQERICIGPNDPAIPDWLKNIPAPEYEYEQDSSLEDWEPKSWLPTYRDLEDEEINAFHGEE
jgi:hypothetical protein